MNGKIERIQHVIMGVRADRKRQIDHKDRDKLNNRRLNFRFCSQAENSRNSGLPKNNTSGYKGVSKNGRNWRALIGFNGGKICLGTFPSRKEAAMAYDLAAVKYFGEFACLNFKESFV